MKRLLKVTASRLIGVALAASMVVIPLQTRGDDQDPPIYSWQSSCYVVNYCTEYFNCTSEGPCNQCEDGHVASELCDLWTQNSECWWEFSPFGDWCGYRRTGEVHGVPGHLCLLDLDGSE